MKPEDVRVEALRTNMHNLQVGLPKYHIKVVHEPTGITVVWSKERSMQANRKAALAALELILNTMVPGYE